MSKYLVIDFNRYDTNQSTHVHVEADSPLDALLLGTGHELDDAEARECFANGMWDAGLEQVDEIFSCLAGEENDYLIYLV